MDVPYLCTITVPLPPPPVPPMPPFDQIFTIIFGSYVLIIGVLTCALVGVASRWCDIAADCRCGAKTITLPPPPTPPRPFIRAQGGYCAAPPVRPRATRRPSCWTAPTPPPLGPFIRAQRGGKASISSGPSSGPSLYPNRQTEPDSCNSQTGNSKQAHSYNWTGPNQTRLSQTSVSDTKPSCIRFSPCSNAPYLSN